MAKGASSYRVLRVGESQVLQLYDLLAWRRAGAEIDYPPPASEDASRAQKLTRMLEHLQSDSLFVWAAQQQGLENLAGYISVARILKPDGRAFFYVDELWVPRPYRRNGIASLLLGEAMETARALHLCCIRLMAADTDAARKLYRQVGFRVEPSGWAELALPSGSEGGAR